MAKPKTEYLQIRVSPDMKSEIQKAADIEDKTMSQYILDAVRAALKRTAREQADKS